jgi:tetratricopeptide (TPR) repeat protein
MTSITRILLPALLAALIAGTPALAQRTGGGAASQPAPEVIDGLLGQLHQAEDEAAAKALEQAVWRAWMRSGSPTVDLLVQQAERAMEENQHRIAISILSSAIELEPEFPEVWNRRATAYYLSRQYERSLADAQRVLELEPRHFAALAGLGVLHKEMGNDRAALQAFRRALAIHPHLSVAQRAVKELELEVEQDI